MKKFNSDHLASAGIFPIGTTITNEAKDFIGVVVGIAGFVNNSEVSFYVEGITADGHFDRIILFASEMERLT